MPAARLRFASAKPHSSSVTLQSPIKLLDSDKLESLRRLDRHRQWRSLDEKRYCLVCATVITGREIQIVGGPGETDPLRAVCPTENCRSIPMDWILPTDEILSAAIDRLQDAGYKRV